MHVVAFSRGKYLYFIHYLEYSTKYRKPDILKHLRFTLDKAKLLEEDQNNNTERLLLCHITKVGSVPGNGSSSLARVHTSANGTELRRRKKLFVPNSLCQKKNQLKRDTKDVNKRKRKQ